MIILNIPYSDIPGDSDVPDYVEKLEKNLCKIFDAEKIESSFNFETDMYTFVIYPY